MATFKIIETFFLNLLVQVYKMELWKQFRLNACVNKPLCDLTNNGTVQYFRKKTDVLNFVIVPLFVVV